MGSSLALNNQLVSYAMGYCELKQCYLTPDNVSEKKCLAKAAVDMNIDSRRISDVCLRLPKISKRLPLGICE